MNAMDEAISKLRKDWKRNGAGSDLGLWWLANDVRCVHSQERSEDEVRHLTLETVRPLLESGNLRAGDMHPDGTFVPWSGTAEESCAAFPKSGRRLGASPTSETLSGSLGSDSSFSETEIRRGDARRHKDWLFVDSDDDACASSCLTDRMPAATYISLRVGVAWVARHVR